MEAMDQLMIKFEIISLGYDDYVILGLCIRNKFWQQFRIENTTLDNWSDSRIWWHDLTGESMKVRLGDDAWENFFDLYLLKLNSKIPNVTLKL